MNSQQKLMLRRTGFPARRKFNRFGRRVGKPVLRAFGGVCFLLLFFACCPAIAAERPNIILIMPDDMGWGDIAAHGNPLIQTPSLDKLYRQSFRFCDFHVSPTCAPTRSALMTGRHEFQNGVTHTINERERLTLKATTLPQVLGKAGYVSGIFGKWHLGDEEPYQPHQRGFNEMFIHGCGGIGQSYPGSCGDFPGNKYFDPYVRHNEDVVKAAGYCTDVFFAQTTKWIDSQRQKKQPFFAYITPNAPHDPLISPGEKYEAPYVGKEIAGQKLTANDVKYYAMITNIDENIGRLMAKLDEWKIADDTLVIFMCDNGGTHTKLFTGGYRGSKNTVYYAGTHTAAFWRWPKGFEGGRDCAAMTAHIDILPTLMEIVGQPLEGELAEQVAGRSLLPLLKDPQEKWADRTLVSHIGRWEFGKAKEAKFKGCAIRNTRYRLVNDKELYDLLEDRGETKNVIDEHPEVVAELRKAYDAWWEKSLPLMVNEEVLGPKVNPYKELFWKKIGK